MCKKEIFNNELNWVDSCQESLLYIINIIKQQNLNWIWWEEMEMPGV